MIFYTTPATADDAIARLVRDGDADPEGTARLNYPGLFAEWPPYDPDAERCVACNVAFRVGDMVLPNADGGLIHIACCGPEREAYVNEDGEPLADDEPIPTGFEWRPVAGIAPEPAPAADDGGTDGPTAADALAYALIGINMARPASRRAPLEDNYAAAATAAAIAFDPRGDFRTAFSWIGSEHAAAGVDERIACAGDFLRANRDARPETMVIHLRLKRFAGVPEATGRAAVAWSVFAYTLAQLDALDQAAKAAAAAAAAAEEAAKRPGARADQLAMRPYDRNPLTDTAQRARPR